MSDWVDIKQALDAWIPAAMSFIQSLHFGPSITYSEMERRREMGLADDEDDPSEYQPASALDPEDAVRHAWDLFDHVPETMALVSALRKTPEVLAHWDQNTFSVESKIPNQVISLRILAPLLTECWRQSGELIVTPKALERVTSQLHQWIYHPDELPIRWRIFFWPLVWDREPRALPIHGAAMRAVSDEESQKFASVGNQRLRFFGMEEMIQEHGCVVEINGPLRNAPEVSRSAVWDHGKMLQDQILLALRLVQPGWVAAQCILIDSANCLNAYDVTMQSSELERDMFARRSQSNAVLDDQAIDSLCSLLPLMDNALKQPDLHVPILRFTDSYRREEDYERYLDCWMALESMLSFGNRDVTQALAAAIAFYLFDTDQDRKIIQKRAKDAYGLRSQLIHGSSRVLPWNPGERLIQTGDIGPRKEAPTHGTLFEWTQSWTREALMRRVRELANTPRYT